MVVALSPFLSVTVRSPALSVLAAVLLGSNVMFSGTMRASNPA